MITQNNKNLSSEYENMFQNLIGTNLKLDKKFDSNKFTGELKSVADSIVKFIIMVQSNIDSLDKYIRNLNDFLNFENEDQIDFESIKLDSIYRNLLSNISIMTLQLKPFFEYKKYAWTVDALYECDIKVEQAIALTEMFMVNLIEE